MLIAELRFGPWGASTHQERAPVRRTAHAPASGRTKDGYGKALPTHYLVQYQKRWYRVRATCYGNSATLWARIGGSDVVVDIWEERAPETQNDENVN